MTLKNTIFSVLIPAMAFLSQAAGGSFINSLGMELVEIPAGTFMMGETAASLPYSVRADLTYPTRSELTGRYPNGDPNNFVIAENHSINGDFDEHPVHEVTITSSLHMSTREVTNAQFRQFDPAHPYNDDNPVTGVSWYQAVSFCGWLGAREDRSYRLPTEAEWEYTCRAGASTSFSSGDSPSAGPNNWGLYDMHGGVEEWCLDWYGPYESGLQVDPIGRIDGDFKVTRGGSNRMVDPSEPHSDYFLRSANRMGELPGQKNPIIGFRVVVAEFPATPGLPLPEPPLNRRKVSQKIPPDIAVPPAGLYFEGPREFVRIPQNSYGPVYSHHNHFPAVTNCPNGDLLAVWYTCIYERARFLAVAASRLRYGQRQWEPASPFWDVPDRNDHCPSLWFDGENTIYHFNGLTPDDHWSPEAIILRTSTDSGATWSMAALIADYGDHKPSEPVFRAQDGGIVFGADGDGGTVLFRSTDDGLTWTKSAGTAAGTHSPVAQLDDGRLIAFGRGNNIDGMSPKSISANMGHTWTYSASVFPPIGGAQRHVLLKLAEGPLFFASPGPDGIYGALSYDQGQTWPDIRLITNVTGPEEDRGINTIDGGRVRLSADTAEPLGYLTVCQAANGVIHLLSSRLHYTFNIQWLQATPPEAAAPVQRQLPARRQLAESYDANKSPTDSADPWMYTGEGAQSEHVSFPQAGIMRITAAGGSMPRWSNERINSFVEADLSRGFTVEIAAQVLSSSSPEEGLELEVFARCGTLKLHNYQIRITPERVYWRGKEIADSLDNAGGIHRYRMAVREDTTVQIYRDQTLLAVETMDTPGTNWRPATRGNFIEWGITADSAEILIGHVSYDFSGGFAPSETCDADFDNSGTVDNMDLDSIADNWLWTGPAGWNVIDLTGDGVANWLDYALLAESWLADCQ